MRNPKLTEWFDGSKFVPCNVGVYETAASINPICSIYFQYWNGEFWGVVRNSINSAIKDKNKKSFCQKSPWRGLAEKP